MCIFKPPDVKAQAPPPAIAPRIEGKQELPQATTIKKEDNAADIQIGSSRKQSSEAAGQRVGAEALKIKLNNPGVDNKAATGGVTIT